jgi:hypothetical protein
VIYNLSLLALPVCCGEDDDPRMEDVAVLGFLAEFAALMALL